MDLIKQLGLGFILEFQAKNLSEVSKFRQQMQGTKGDIGGVISELEKVDRRIQSNQKLQKVGLGLAATGAGMLASSILAAKQGMENQQTWTGMAQSLVLQQKISRDAAEALVKQRENFVDSLAATTIGLPTNELTDAYIKMASVIGDTTAQSAFTDAMKMAEITMGTTEAAALQGADAVSKFWKVFATEQGGLAKSERSLRISNALVIANKQYAASVPEVTEAMRFMADEAGIMGLKMAPTMALMMPLVQMGVPSRAIGSAIATFEGNILNFDAKIKEMQKSGLTGAITLEALRSEEQRQGAITQAERNQWKIQVVDATGRKRSDWDIIADIEKSVGLTAEKIAKVDADIASGKLSPNDRSKALGLSMDQQNALTKYWGSGIGYWIGKSKVMRDMEASFSDTTAIQRLFGMTEQDASHETTLVKNAMSDLYEELGTNLLPAVKEFSKVITPMLTGVTQFMKDHPTMTQVGAVMYGGGGALLSGGATAMTAGLGVANWWMIRKAVKTFAEREAATTAKAIAGGAARLAPWEQGGGIVDDVLKTQESNLSKLGMLVKGAGGKYLSRSLRVLGPAGLAWAAKDYLEGEPVGRQSLSEIGGLKAMLSQSYEDRVAMNSFNPLLDMGVGTAFDMKAHMRERSRLISAIYSETPASARMQAESRDQASSPQTFYFGDVNIVVPEGGNANDYVKAFDDYVSEKSERSTKGQF